MRSGHAVRNAVVCQCTTQRQETIDASHSSAILRNHGQLLRHPLYTTGRPTEDFGAGQSRRVRSIQVQQDRRGTLHTRTAYGREKSPFISVSLRYGTYSTGCLQTLGQIPGQLAPLQSQPRHEETAKPPPGFRCQSTVRVHDAASLLGRTQHRVGPTSFDANPFASHAGTVHQRGPSLPSRLPALQLCPIAAQTCVSGTTMRPG
jgi:hypothetical protein